MKTTQSASRLKKMCPHKEEQSQFDPSNRS